LNKLFKNIIRFIVWGIFILYVTVSIILDIPLIQKKMASAISTSLGQMLKTEVSIGHISFDIFKRIIIEDVCLHDKQGEKMISISRLSARYELLSLFEEKITINSIQLLGFNVNLKKETPKSEANIQFLLDAFANKDTLRKDSNLDLRINSILVRRGIVNYDITSVPETPGIFNSSHIGINNLEATISIKALKRDSLNASIRRLAFKEKSGLELKKLGVKIIADNQKLRMNDFTIQFQESEISLTQMNVHYDSLHHVSMMSPDVNYEGNLCASVSLSDLSFIAPQLKNLKQPISLTSFFNGKGKDFNLTSLFLKDNKHINLQGNVSLMNWDAGKKMYFKANLNEFSMNEAGLEYLIGGVTENGNVPPTIQRMEYVKFKGHAEGHPYDLFIHGEADTGIGLLNMDIQMKANEKNIYSYIGNIQSNELNLNTLLDNDNFGKAQFNVQVKCQEKNGRYPESYIKGIISSLEYNNYQYEDIIMDGIYKDGGFNGHLSLNDENGIAKLDGIFNFVQPIPTFNLQVTVNKFRPHNLNLSDKYIDSDISFKLKADFRGKTPDAIDGYMKLDSLVINTPNEQGYFLDSLKLIADQNNNERYLKIESPFLQAVIHGNFSYQTIPTSVSSMLQHHLPSLIKTDGQVQTANNFQFEIHLNNSEFFQKVLYIPIQLHMPASLSGYIYDTRKKMYIEGSFPKLEYKGTLYESGALLCENLFNDFNCQLHGSMMMGSGAMLNLSAKARAQEDQIKTILNWGNNTDVTYTGQCSTITHFSQSPADSLLLLTDIEILPTTMVLSDSIWNIRPSHIGIEKGCFQIDNFKIERPEQYLEINGRIGKENTDSCLIALKNIDIRYVLDMLQFDDVLFGGLATGKVSLNNILDVPSMNTQLHVHQFTVNNGLMGNANIYGIWDNQLPGIRLEAQMEEENLSSTRVTGYVTPKLKALDLMIEADSTNMDLLTPYIDGIFSELDGRINGNIHLFGGFKSLDLSGAASVTMDAKLDVLNTYFQIHQDSVHIQEGKFAFNNVHISDYEGNKGIVNGALQHTHLKNLNYHFNIHAENLLIYNTQENDENLFYGKVYGTGDILVNGGNNAMTVDATIATGPNTTFTYINGTSSEAANNHFITFFDKTPKRIQDSIYTEFYHYTDGYKTEKDEGPSMDLRMNMKIDATPNAQMKVIMDPLAGDNITARGNGNFQVDFYNKGDFRMFGHYTIDDGMYKLNMQDIIRKDFILQSGSTVTFTGDPYQANLDIQAIYTVNSASLSDLTTDISQNQSTVKVNCIMNLTGSLANPTLKFDLDLPSVSEEDRELVRSLVSTEEQMNTQIIYLLGIGKFYTYDYTENPNRSDATSSLAFSTLSSQFNNMLSQVMENKNWNIGANLSSGMDGWNGVEAEAILSGRLLNNRLLINGNFGYRENVMENTNFVGDFEAIWLLTPNGDFRIRGYNQTNDRYFFGSTLTTQGIGFIYKKDFNKWNELFQWVVRKRNKDKTKR